MNNNNIQFLSLTLEIRNGKQLSNIEDPGNALKNETIKKQLAIFFSLNKQKPWSVLTSLRDKESGAVHITDPINHKTTIQVTLRKVAAAISCFRNNNMNHWTNTKPDNPVWSLAHSGKTKCAAGDPRSCEEVFPYSKLAGNGLKQKPAGMSDEDWTALNIRLIDNCLSHSELSLEEYFLGSQSYIADTGDTRKYKHSLKYLQYKKNENEKQLITKKKRGSSLDFETPKPKKKKIDQNNDITINTVYENDVNIEEDPASPIFKKKTKVATNSKMNNSFIGHFRNPEKQPSHISRELKSNKNSENVRRSLPTLNCPAVSKIQAPRADKIISKVITKNMKEKDVVNKSFVRTTFNKNDSEEIENQMENDDHETEDSSSSILKCEKKYIKNITIRKKNINVPKTIAFEGVEENDTFSVPNPVNTVNSSVNFGKITVEESENDDDNEDVECMSQNTRHEAEMTDEAQKLFGFSSIESCTRGDDTRENLEKRRIDFTKYTYVPYSQRPNKMPTNSSKLKRINKKS